jgi:hypothetical protein
MIGCALIVYFRVLCGRRGNDLHPLWLYWPVVGSGGFGRQ